MSRTREELETLPGPLLVREIEDTYFDGYNRTAAWQEVKRRLETPNLLSRMFAQVARFNREIIGLPDANMFAHPSMLTGPRFRHAQDHLREEVDEFRDATTTAEQTDALLDLIYVAMGRLFEMGVAPGAAFEEVHHANMKRQRGQPKHRNADNSMNYDAVKPPGWTPPDLGPFITATRDDLRFISENREAFEALKATIAAGGAFGRFAGPPMPQSFPKPASIHTQHANLVENRIHGMSNDELAAHYSSHFGAEVTVTDPDPAIAEDFRRVGLEVGPQVNIPLSALFPDVVRDELPIKRPKLLLLGYARHGKDTVAEYLRDRYGFSFTSSSLFCAENVIMPALERDFRIQYDSAADCMADRETVGDARDVEQLKGQKWRAYWYDAITAYNTPDRARLAREITAEHDLYVGMRDKRELYASRLAKVFDLVLWVDGTNRLPPEDKSSCTVEPWMADVVIDGNGTVQDTYASVDALMAAIGIQPLYVQEDKDTVASALERAVAGVRVPFGYGIDNGVCNNANMRGSL